MGWACRESTPLCYGPVRSKASHLEQSPRVSEQIRVLESLSMLQDGMQSIKSRVTSLEKKEAESATPSPIPRGPGSSRDSTGRVQRSTRQSLQDDPLPTLTPPRSESTLHWADRDDEVMDYEAEVTWDVDDDDLTETKGVKLFKVGERTEKFLDSHFSEPLPNQTRCQWRDKYGAPSTACPTMDKVIKGRLPAATKLQDRQLAKQQASCWIL